MNWENFAPKLERLKRPKEELIRTNLWHLQGRENSLSRHTPLTTDRSRILEEALNVDLLTTLKRTNTPPNADQTKHCRYHRNFGHTTEDCWALKDKIEELVQANHLRRFVQGNQEDRRPRVDERRTNRRENRSRDDREDREPHSHREGRPVRGVINTIAGGFARGGTTYSSRKRHLRAISSVYSIHRRPRRSMPPILFTDDVIAVVLLSN